MEAAHARERAGRLRGKVAFVTGGGSGMGLAVAAGFAREGARVVIADVDEAAGRGAEDRLARDGGTVLFIRTDVADAGSVDAAVRIAVDRFRGIDVLYNNAGVQLVGQEGRAHELSEAVWDRTFAVNVRGAWLCAKHVIPSMLERGGGSIVNVSSATGLLGMAPEYPAYSASKAALIGLTRALATQYGSDAIRVNALVPGLVETPLTVPLLAAPGARDAILGRTPLGRLGQPEDVVGLAVFLASDDSAYCTGGVYAADGGLSAA